MSDAFEPSVELIRRIAKVASREAKYTGGLSHQGALNLIATRLGYSDWGNLKSRLPARGEHDDQYFIGREGLYRRLPDATLRWKASLHPADRAKSYVPQRFSDPTVTPHDQEMIALRDVLVDDIKPFVSELRPYSFVVTHEDFDEYDQLAPVGYKGVSVKADEARRYTDGLALCWERGIAPMSRPGLALQLSVSGRNPSDAYQILVDRAIAEEERVRQRKDRFAEYQRIIEGFANVGPDEYSGQYWGSDAPKCPVLWSGKVPEYAHATEKTDHHHTIKQMPNGDLLVVINGQAWTRLTKDPKLAEERLARANIPGYQYSSQVGQLLVEATRNGALRDNFGDWLGGTAAIPRFEESGYWQPNYAGKMANTAKEKRARFSKHLQKVAEYPGKTQEQLATIRALQTLVANSDDWLTEGPARATS